MKSSVRNNDKFASVMMAAFLIMGSAHFACRYDLGTLVEGFFQKASAETIISQDSAADSGAPATIISEQGIISKAIARNPFLMPVAATPNPTQITPTFPSGNIPYTPSKNSAPVIPAEPQLRGIISKAGKAFAIIEYQGTSSYYSVGQAIGNYTVNNISQKSVLLSGPGNSLELYMGGSN